jgi:hypothetical protein
MNNDQKQLVRITLLIGFVVGCGFVMLLDALGSNALKWHRESVVRNMEPQMQTLAKSGWPDAVLWLAQQYPTDEVLWARVEALAEEGNTEAMYELAARLWRRDQARAKGLLVRAADEGYAPAIQTLQSLEPPSVLAARLMGAPAPAH